MAVDVDEVEAGGDAEAALGDALEVVDGDVSVAAVDDDFADAARDGGAGGVVGDDVVDAGGVEGGEDGVLVGLELHAHCCVGALEVLAEACRRGDELAVARVEDGGGAADKGTSYGAPTLAETELAKLVCRLVPSMDQVRMVNSGTEATMSALRLARAYTGRDCISQVSME